MIKKIAGCIISIILFSHALGITAENIGGAREFIDNFLKSEFNGGQDNRVDNAVYSPERKKLIKEMYGPLKGEIFFWESEKLCVVDNYKIKDIMINQSKAFVDVKFEEFACTGNKGYGRSPLIKTIKESVVTYSLENKNGRWLVIDPPIPRISKKALVDYNIQQIKLMSDWIMEKGSKAQKEFYHNLISTNEMLNPKPGESESAKTTENKGGE